MGVRRLLILPTLRRRDRAVAEGGSVPHWRSLIERDSIGAWDLVDKSGKPRDFTLEISGVRGVKVKSKENPKGRGKPVIAFKGAEKYLIAGAVNCQTIAGMYGDNVESWVGNAITLYATTTDVGPKRDVPCVRVRPTKPSGKADAILPSQAVDPEMRAKQDAAFGREPGSDDQ
jgi:hypothetical protein